MIEQAFYIACMVILVFMMICFILGLIYGIIEAVTKKGFWIGLGILLLIIWLSHLK